MLRRSVSYSRHAGIRLAIHRLRQRRIEAVISACWAMAGAAHGLRLQRRRRLRGRAARAQPRHAGGIRGEVSPARPRRGEQPGTEAGGRHGPERLAPRAEGSAAAGAMETNDGATAATSNSPGVPRAAATSTPWAPWSSPSSRARAARARCGLPTLRSRTARPTRAAEATASSALPGFGASCCAAVTPAGDRAPMMRSPGFDRLDRASGHRRFDHRLARGTRRQAAFACAARTPAVRWKTVYMRPPRAGGKRSYVYLPALKTRFLRLRARRAIGGRGAARAIVRVLALHPRLLE